MSSKAGSDPGLDSTQTHNKIKSEPKPSPVVRENRPDKKTHELNSQPDVSKRCSSQKSSGKKNAKSASNPVVTHQPENHNKHTCSSAGGKNKDHKSTQNKNKSASSRKRSGDMPKNSSKGNSQQVLHSRKKKKTNNSSNKKREGRNSTVTKNVSAAARNSKKRRQNPRTKKAMNAAGEVRSASSPRGREVIGRYVKVKFEGGKWYRARVDNYSSSRRKRYHITYDDGDDEWVTLTDADVQLVSEAYCHPSAAHRHEKSDVKKASRKRSRSSASSRHRRESKDRSNANNSSSKSNAASDKSNTQTKIRKEQPVKRSRRAVESADRSSASKIKKDLYICFRF